MQERMKHRLFDHRFFEALKDASEEKFLRCVKRCMPIGGGKNFSHFIHIDDGRSTDYGAYAKSVEKKEWYAWFWKGMPRVPSDSPLGEVLERAVGLEEKLSFYGPPSSEW